MKKQLLTRQQQADLAYLTLIWIFIVIVAINVFHLWVEYQQQLAWLESLK